MDYVFNSIFQFDQSSLQHDHELLFHTIQEHDQVLPPTPSRDGRDDRLTNFKPNSSQQKRKASSSKSKGGIDDVRDPKAINKKKIKKIVHRDVERQRRQEMATLYASLRSHLPLEYLKGRRSISDHVHQTVSYIKHLQSNIQEMQDKRDELKRSCNVPSSPSGSGGTRNSQSPIRDSVISITPCRAGMEIVVNTPAKEGLALSRVLDVLLGEGLCIITCTSAQANERFLHTIESEVCDGRSIDIAELQQKLTKTHD